MHNGNGNSLFLGQAIGRIDANLTDLRHRSNRIEGLLRAIMQELQDLRRLQTEAQSENMGDYLNRVLSNVKAVAYIVILSFVLVGTLLGQVNLKTIQGFLGVMGP